MSVKKDYMGMRWEDLVLISLRGRSNRELEEIQAVALERAVNSEESTVVRAEADMLSGRIEAEQERRSDRTMLPDRARQSHGDRGNRSRDSNTGARAAGKRDVMIRQVSRAFVLASPRSTFSGRKGVKRQLAHCTKKGGSK